jgi:hypothetical protein
MDDALEAAYRFLRNKSVLVYTHFVLRPEMVPRSDAGGCEF